MFSNRTKKLRKDLNEETIKGDEYSKRLRKFQQKIAENNKNELFKWAYDNMDDENKDGNRFGIDGNEESENLLTNLIKTNTKI